MTNDEVVYQLSELLETCKGGEYAYRACAKHAKSSELKVVFMYRAEDCRGAASELEFLLERRGASKGGSRSRRANRYSVCQVGTLASHCDKAILSECKRGAHAALERYRGALKLPLPAEVMGIVRAQYDALSWNSEQMLRGRSDVLEENCGMARKLRRLRADCAGSRITCDAQQLHPL